MSIEHGGLYVFCSFIIKPDAEHYKTHRKRHKITLNKLEGNCLAVFSGVLEGSQVVMLDAGGRMRCALYCCTPVGNLQQNCDCRSRTAGEGGNGKGLAFRFADSGSVGGADGSSWRLLPSA